FQAEDGIRDFHVTGVQTCALPIWNRWCAPSRYPGNRAPAAVHTAQAHRVVFRGLPKSLALLLFLAYVAGSDLPVAGRCAISACRSEERRVGKEWRSLCCQDRVGER